jgi:putative ABC transport system substrate-binding protein
MRRREFITAIGSAAAWPLVARAQQLHIRRVGVVMAYTEKDPNGQLQVAGFRQQLQKLGWTEGQEYPDRFSVCR